MTFEEIDNLQANRETDILIAEKIGGWTSIYQNGHTEDYRGWNGSEYQDVPEFTKNLFEVWKLIHKIRFPKSTDKSIRLEYIGSCSVWRVEMYYCEFYVASGSKLDSEGPSDDELALLICRCLLKVYFYNNP